MIPLTYTHLARLSRNKLDYQRKNGVLRQSKNLTGQLIMNPKIDRMKILHFSAAKAFSPLPQISRANLYFILQLPFVRSVGRTVGRMIPLANFVDMTVGTTFPRKIVNNGKEPCEPLMASSYAHHSEYSIKTLTKHFRLNFVDMFLWQAT